MARPLYRTDTEPTLDTGGHAGLWYDKFCNSWELQSPRTDRNDARWSMSSDGDGRNPKLKWIQTVTGRVGTPGELSEHAFRIMRMFDGSGGRWSVFAACSRFVTGLGRSHPVENGFAWHPTLATPYLPGSSIKGMVRAWAKAEGESDARGSRLERLLGDRERTGTISFLDAVPIEPVRLDADVMTPHYANWTSDDPPGDWCSPIPIPFLTVAEGAKMLVGAIPRRGTARDDVEVVMNWIVEALAWQGAGAKTAVGYGRFERDETREGELRAKLAEERKQAEREALRRQMTPLQRQIEDIIDQRPNKQEKRSVAIYRKALEGLWNDDDLQEVATWLKSEMQRDGTWTSKKKQKKAYQRTIDVNRWLGEE